MTQLLLIFVLLSSISAVLAWIMKYKFEQALPVACLGLIVFVYFCGLVGHLRVGFYLSVAAGIGATVFCVVGTFKGWLKRDFWLTCILSPGFVVFCLFAIFTYCVHTGRLLTEWDEFSHWGLVVKNMYALDAFGNHPDSTVMFKGYPPTSATFQYLWMKLSGAYSEENLFRSMNILCFAFVLPVFKNISWKNIKVVPSVSLIIFVLPITFYSTFYKSIYVDALLGVLFAYILFTYFTANKYDAFFLINLALAIFALTLVKASGFGLSLISAVIIIFDILIQPRLLRGKDRESVKFEPPKNKKKSADSDWPDVLIEKPLYVILTVALTPFVSNYSWSVYRSITGTGQPWSGMSNLTLPAVLSFLRGESEQYRYTVLENFGKAIFEHPISTSFLKMTVFMFFLLLAAFTILIWNLINNKYLKRRIKFFCIGLFIGGVLYTISLVALYIFTYSEYEAVRLASFQRYMDTYLLACLLFLSFCFIYYFDNRAKMHKIKSTATCMTVYLVALCFLANLEFLIANFSYDEILQSQNIRQSTDSINKIIPILDAKSDRLSYIYQNSNGYEITVAQYNMTPIKITNGGSLGDPYYEGDIWTTRISCEEWIEQLRNNCTYVYLANIDSQFIDGFSSAFENKEQIQNNSLYRVQESRGSIILTYVDI